MRIANTRLLPFLFFILPLSSGGQVYSYTNYSSREGLAGTTVYCIQQDKEGFLWFGTETGLSRFDGTRFKNFTTTDGLPDNEILRLYTDSKNRVWIIPFKNSICYYWKGKIFNKDNDSLISRLGIKGGVRRVLEDRYGNILVHGPYSVAVIKPDGTIDRINDVDGAEFSIEEAGLNEKGGFKLVLKVVLKGTFFFELNNGILKMLERDSRLLVTTLPFSYMVFPDWEVAKRDDSLIFYQVARDEIFSIAIPGNFLSTHRLNDSLFVVNAASRSIVYNVNQKRIAEEFLVGHNITAVLEDDERNIWLATTGQGIFRLLSRDFRNIHLVDNKISLPVFSIHNSGSHIYIGTSNSLLWTFDRHRGILGKQRQLSALKNERLLGIVNGPDKKLLIATDGGIYEAAETSRKISPPIAIKSILFYRDTLLAATAMNTLIATEATPNGWKDTDILQMRSTCAIPYMNGYYIGTLNGLYQVNKKKEIIFLGEKNELLTNRIAAIVKTMDDMVWIATYGNGLIGLSHGRIVHHITQDKGLSSNICRNLFLSGNDLWIGTDKGLNKLVSKDNQIVITKITMADGLSSDIINAVYVDGDIVYAGTPEGVTYFNEKKVSQSFGCALRVTAINISDQVWNFDTTGFSLRHKDNNIHIEFAGLSYKSAGDITYQYRLIGLDSTWRTTKENFLSYPALPSGKYELQLAAINKFGIRSDIKTVQFTIQQLLKEKTWFKLSLLLGAGACCWLVTGFYINRIRKKEAEKANTLRKVSELEQMALRAQMNPHFIFNSLNSIQQYVMEKDIAGANKFITDFSSLIRQTLDFSSRQEVSLAEDLQYLSTYLELEKTRMENKFECEINIDPTIDAAEYLIPPMLLQPYVENSIRHGIGYRKDKLGKIVIDVFRQDGWLVCSIEDNGVGRRVAEHFKKSRLTNQQSKGMSVTAARIEMFNKSGRHKIELSIHDKMDQEGNVMGTQVAIKLAGWHRETLQNNGV